tara:strand:+ start:62 stop:568 length:507 start_codon:yes stop_codon:yes gene_type:complete
VQEAKKKYIDLFQQMSDLCTAEGWGDPHSYARSKEILAACHLGHEVSGTLSGADAFNEKGHPVEYKSTTGAKVKGSYTGISVQPSWEEQVKYLREDKILKYSEHYFNRFEGGELAESWVLTGQQVYDILLPKLRGKYSDVLYKKDPRLSATVTTTEIKKLGKRAWSKG